MNCRIIFSAALVLGACGAPSHAPAPAPHVASPPIAGGYTVQDPTTAEAKQLGERTVALLQDKLTDQTLELVAVRSIAMQIVAGRNYRLDLNITSADGPRTITVVMFEDLKRNYSIGSGDRILPSNPL